MVMKLGGGDAENYGGFGNITPPASPVPVTPTTQAPSQPNPQTTPQPGQGYNPESAEFKSLPRHIQIQVEKGGMSLAQAMQAAQNYTPGPVNAPGTPKPPVPRVEPTAPVGTQQTQGTAGQPYRGRPGLTSEQVNKPQTFSAPGSKEHASRGFQGAVFSPLSLFGSMAGKMGAFDRGGPGGNSGTPIGGNTLVQSSPSLGGGVPIDGGLSQPVGTEDFKQILGQLLERQ